MFWICFPLLASNVPCSGFITLMPHVSYRLSGKMTAPTLSDLRQLEHITPH